MSLDLPTAHARAALTREPDLLALDDPRGDRYAQGARLRRDVAVRSDLGRAQFERARSTAVRVLEVDLDAGDVVLASSRKAARFSASLRTSCASCSSLNRSSASFSLLTSGWNLRASLR